jgi:hypothetical protein
MSLTDLHPLTKKYFIMLKKQKFHNNLWHLCNDAFRHDEHTFIPIRKWLQNMVERPKTRYKQESLVAETTYFLPWSRETALHLLLTKCPPLDIIELYVTLAPGVLMMMDRQCMLPLHVACYNYHHFIIPHVCHHWTLGLFDKLTKHHPETFLMKDRTERTPSNIMKTFGWLLEKDNEGMTLLHHACLHVFSIPLLNFIVDGGPDCVNITDNYDRKPSTLLKISGLAEIKDDDGKLMLHHVCSLHECNKELLKLVFTAFPDAITHQDNFGLNSFHYACLNKSLSLDFLKNLIEFCPDIIIADI